MRIIALVSFIIGLFLIAYPYVSDYLNKQQLNAVMDTQDEKIEQIAKHDTTKVDKEMKRALSYNESLCKGTNVISDPFDPNRSAVSDKDYMECLNILGDNVMGHITIPSINIKLPIYHTVNDDVLQMGVGHLETTSLPCGGTTSHCVLTGHTGLPSVEIFDQLDKLKKGDYFVLNILGQDHAYKVYDIQTVLPSNTQSLGLVKGKDLCTLVTCTPYGINSHRLLVHGERIDVPKDYYEVNSDNTPQFSRKTNSIFTYSLIGIIAGMLVFYLYKKYIDYKKFSSRKH